jgi:hypothetical protein
MTTEPAAAYTVIYIDDELTEKEWEEHCQKVVEDRGRKLKESHENRNSTSPWEK